LIFLLLLVSLLLGRFAGVLHGLLHLLSFCFSVLLGLSTLLFGGNEAREGARLGPRALAELRGVLVQEVDLEEVMLKKKG